MRVKMESAFYSCWHQWFFIKPNFLVQVAFLTIPPSQVASVREKPRRLDHRHRPHHRDVRAKSGHAGPLQEAGSQPRQNPQEPDHVRILARARRQRHQRPLPPDQDHPAAQNSGSGRSGNVRDDEWHHGSGEQSFPARFCLIKISGCLGTVADPQAHVSLLRLICQRLASIVDNSCLNWSRAISGKSRKGCSYS